MESMTDLYGAGHPNWLREAGVPDGALKANEPAPDFLLPEANRKLVSSLELRQTALSRPSTLQQPWLQACDKLEHEEAGPGLVI
jgi:hypothetical protein